MSSLRLCVFVPEDALEEFIAAVSPHIPAFLGGYDHVCWWSEKGVEQSRKLPDGEIKHVPCRKFECSLPGEEAIVSDFIEKIIRPNHPWEEPVITLSHQSIAIPPQT